MTRRYDDVGGYWIDACGKCGREGPIREGDIESCVSLQGGSFVLQLCPACRATTTVEQAIQILTKGPRPKRVSLVDQVAELTARIEALEYRSAGNGRVPQSGQLAYAVGADGDPIGIIAVDESDSVGDVVGPWWSGTIVGTNDRLERLRPCHFAGLAPRNTPP